MISSEDEKIKDQEFDDWFDDQPEEFTKRVWNDGYASARREADAINVLVDSLDEDPDSEDFDCEDDDIW